MNKRQAKKRLKKIDVWVGLDFTPFKCHYCSNFDSGDSDVGIPDGCEADYLYDGDGNFLEEMNDKAVGYMEKLGWTCPYFRPKNKGGKAVKMPKKYKEIKKIVDAERKYYDFLGEDKNYLL